MCRTCGSFFYALQTQDRCFSAECSGLYIPAHPIESNSVSLEDFWRRTHAWFTANKFEMVSRSNIVNDVGNTYFVGAGLQYFDAIVFKEVPFVPLPKLVPQPSIRLNYLNRAGRDEGISTSFLNLCTEQIASGLDQYLAHLGVWLGYLRETGLTLSRLSIKVSEYLWAADRFRGWSLLFHYAGLEMGDAIYIFGVPQKTRQSLSIVDFSFGLERLFWAATSKSSYFISLGPTIDVLAGRNVIIDLLRTVTLMTLSGVVPGARRHGRLLRNLLKHAQPDLLPTDLYRIVTYSYQYWSMFIEPAVPIQHCIEIIEREMWRSSNIALAAWLGETINIQKEYLAQPTKYFSEHLLRHPKRLRSERTIHALKPEGNGNSVLLAAPSKDERSISSNFNDVAELFRLTGSAPDRNSQIIDLGAGAGLFSCVAAQQVPDGHVYATESNQEQIRLLRKNVILNDLTNVSAVELTIIANDAQRAARSYDSLAPTESGDRNHATTKPTGRVTLEQLMKHYQIRRVYMLRLGIKSLSRDILLTTSTHILKEFRSIIIRISPANDTSEIHEILSCLNNCRFQETNYETADKESWIVAANLDFG